MRKALPQPEIERLLAELPGWELAVDRIKKRFQFESFTEAFSWMTQVAFSAEQMNHHPEWSNVYHRVEVELTTHDAPGLTQLDFRMAKTMDRFERGIIAGRGPST